jgi:hypothetical protein
MPKAKQAMSFDFIGISVSVGIFGAMLTQLIASL